jgi:hypothetical protein
MQVACNGVRAVSTGVCDWSDKCTDPSLDEPDCPFTGEAKAAYVQCGSYPTPGLVSGELPRACAACSIES